MDFAAIGSALGGLGSFASGVGGLFGGSKMTANKMAKAAIKQQEVFRSQLPLNIKAFKDSGIHPLAALGQLPSAGSGGAMIGSSGNDFGNSLYQMGQGIHGAASAFSSREEKALSKVSAELSLEHQKLQNDYLRAQIQHISPVGRPQGFSLEPVVSGSNAIGFDSGLSSDVSRVQSQSGYRAVVPSESVKQQIEDQIVPEMQWMLRQALAPKQPGYTYNPFTSEMVPDDQSYIRKFLDAISLSNLSKGVKPPADLSDRELEEWYQSLKRRAR